MILGVEVFEVAKPVVGFFRTKFNSKSQNLYSCNIYAIWLQSKYSLLYTINLQYTFNIAPI